MSDTTSTASANPSTNPPGDGSAIGGENRKRERRTLGQCGIFIRNWIPADQHKMLFDGYSGAYRSAVESGTAKVTDEILGRIESAWNAVVTANTDFLVSFREDNEDLPEWGQKLEARKSKGEMSPEELLATLTALMDKAKAMGLNLPL